MEGHSATEEVQDCWRASAMKDMRKYHKVADNQRWLDGLWNEIGHIFYKGIVIRGKRQNTCSMMQTKLVPVLQLNQMSDERWNEIAERMSGR